MIGKVIILYISIFYKFGNSEIRLIMRDKKEKNWKLNNRISSLIECH